MEAPMGRPRSFDRDAALDVALGLFWTRGYEGVSISDLTSAMGIAPPSLYAAFGAKQALFEEVLDLYEAREGAAFAAALADEQSVQGAMRRMLHEAARTYTRGGPNRGRGCLVSSALQGCAADHAEVADLVRLRRAAARAGIRQRLEQGVEAGQLGADVDLDALAGFLDAVRNGQSVLARDGADEALLRAIADRAMAAWPRATDAG
jgi:AcrR family transcriptional regulator